MNLLRNLIFRLLDRYISSERNCRKFREKQLRETAGSVPFVHLPRPKSGQLFLIYSGMDANYLPKSMYVNLGLFRFLQATGLGSRNVTWIRDPFLDNYKQGFGPEIPNLESLTEWHRQHLAAMPHVREVYAIGYSSGAYGALLFGHLLGATKVWAFSPRTSSPTREEDDEARKELRDRLLTYNGVTKYEIWYDRKNRADQRFADLLHECEGVTNHPHPGFGGTHFLLNQMVHRGEFQALLPDDPGAEPPAEERTATTEKTPVVVDG